MKDELMDKAFRFQCDRWLAKNDDDGQIIRELACANNDYLDLDEKTSKAGTNGAHTLRFRRASGPQNHSIVIKETVKHDFIEILLI